MTEPSSASNELPSRRTVPLGPSPFAPNLPSIIMSLVYLAAIFLWLVAGELLPGGRWFAIHLFTLGVLTNLILTFSHHFALTVTRGNQHVHPAWQIVTNIGIVLVLIGLPADTLVLLITGAAITTASVFAAYLRLRNLRRRALGVRFNWLVRVYERAHGAFIHGAVLGALVGANVVAGPWWGSVRLAHLHANILGWAGLTLIGTLVFFGPTMMHTKIWPNADVKAAKLLKWGASALTLAIVLLIFTGASGLAATIARFGAAVALAVFAYTVTAVCLPIAKVARNAKHSAQRPLVIALTVWFPLTVWADVAVIATATWRFLDAIGAAAFIGVFAQAVLATLMYVAPLLRGRSTPARELIRSRLLLLARTRAVLVSVGAVFVAIGSTRMATDLPLAATGFTVLAATLAFTFVAVLRPVNRPLAPSQL